MALWLPKELTIDRKEFRDALAKSGLEKLVQQYEPKGVNSRGSHNG